MKRIFIHIVIFIGIFGCVEPYEFEVTETAEVLVVDGVFSTEQKAHQVKISITGDLDTNEFEPVVGAKVWIMEGATTRIDLTEISDGVHETAPTVQGVSGQSYTLFIELKDGSNYNSTTDILPAPIAIDSVYGKFLEIPSTENDEILRGIQFLVDAHNDVEDFSNFRYEYIEDYEIRVPYPSLFEWDENTQTYGPRAIKIGTCYGRNESIELIAATTNGQLENRLSEFPIQMVEEDDAQLNYKYSIIVKQFAITSSAYQYYKNLKENNESSGSFFDKQKGSLPGNIINSNGTGVGVLGYFELSGVSSETTFFIPDQFEDQGFLPINPFRSSCAYEMAVDSVSTGLLSNQTMSGKNIYNFTFPIPDTAILITELCSDCRFHGDIDKPDFWN